MKNFFTYLLFFFPACFQLSAQQMQDKKNDYTHFLQSQKNVSRELIAITSEKDQQHPEFGTLPYNAPCTDCYEDLGKRKPDERYFVKNGTGGKEFYIQRSYGPIHYYDENNFLRTIDWNLYPTKTPGVYAAASQQIPAKIDCREKYCSLTLSDHFEFKYNQHLQLKYQTGDQYSGPIGARFKDHTAGKDGVYITNSWNNIDCEIAVRKGAIKTNFIVHDKTVIDPQSDYLIIEDFISLPEGYYFSEEDDFGYYIEKELWKGDILLKNRSGLKLLTMQRPLIIDQNKNKTHNKDQIDAIGYNLVKAEGGYILQIKVRTKWLLAAERKYPVIIDPTLIGEAIYVAGDIGFEFNGVCFDLSDYCNYFLDITVPGKTTLTAAYFDGTYYSQNFGCFFTTDCLKKEAAFRILGPCDDSPSPTGYWTCLPPEGDTAGTCFGIDLDMFNTIACIEPQCEDYEFTFEMRTFMCSCTKPPCDITCHFMPSGTWVITIEGKTVEEDNIESDLYPEFTICEGDTIDLFASGNWGVPPYTYEWEELGVFSDVVLVWPTDTTTYTSIIHDICDMQDTVYQIVNVIPSPELSPGPFEACFEVMADAGSGYESYLWSTGETTQTILVDSAGFYFVTVTDGNGCEGISEPIEVIINYPPEIDAFPDTVYVENDELAQLNVTTTSSGDVTYSWSPLISVTCSDCADPLGIVTDAQQIFTVTGEEFGCVGDPDTIVVINSSTDFFVPNAFSPNGDLLNDIFQATSEIDYPVFQMQIYNRWGTEVFESNDMHIGWDGTYLGKQQEVGAYIWVINYERLNRKGVMLMRKGTVVLLR
ncbi:MAG: gliding motility-associated C-terminal domain-containing protein [Chitinophagales bacterium]|nr:gliding motility-associated C-terminal domain-containing protein [Chitinophagales bacterium]